MGLQVLHFCHMIRISQSARVCDKTWNKQELLLSWDKCEDFYCQSIMIFTVILSPVLSVLETCSEYLDTERLDFVVYRNDKSTVICGYMLLKRVCPGITSVLVLMFGKGNYCYCILGSGRRSGLRV